MLIAVSVRYLQVLAEARVRLVAGLKRYFHEKRGQGLLSGRGIVELDHACDAAMDRSDQPLSIWTVVERCACCAVPTLAALAACNSCHPESQHSQMRIF